MKENDVLELAQRATLSGRPIEDRVTVSISFFRQLLRVAIRDTFSEDWYLAKYPDVKRAVEENLILSGLDHYIDSGIYEGRFPFDFEVDQDTYFRNHPDVADAVEDGTFPSAQHHFSLIGYAEGRRFSLKAQNLSNKFGKTGSK